eukprot:350682-Chlamydomonas_euryale.AAC.6
MAVCNGVNPIYACMQAWHGTPGTAPPGPAQPVICGRTWARCGTRGCAHVPAEPFQGQDVWLRVPTLAIPALVWQGKGPSAICAER